MDDGGTSDPFVKIAFLSQSFSTKVIPKTLNPEFNETVTLQWPAGSNPEAEELTISIFDHDKGRFFGSSSEYLGSCTLHLSSVQLGQHWYELEYNAKHSNTKSYYEITGRVLLDVHIDSDI